MKNKAWTKVFTVIMVASLAFGTVTMGLTGCKDQKESLSKNSAQGVPKIDSREQATYTLNKEGLNYDEFTNHVDGYRIRIPRDMTVDMSLSGVRATLENKEQRIEIYRQEFDTAAGISAESYTNYSNVFLENQVDHKIEFQQSFQLGGFDIAVNQWSRKPLKYIKNDKCFYASVDVFTTETDCVTFLFKSNQPYGIGNEKKDYLDIIKSFALEEKTVAAYNRKIQQVENKSWDEKTKETYEQYFGNEAELTWGIFDKTAPLDFTKLHETETRLDYQFPILLYYTGFLQDTDKHPSLASGLANAKKNGRTLELTLQTLSQDEGKGNMVYDVLNGEYDTYLKNYVADVKAYGEPVLFRIGNEMNGDWCVYSAYHTSKDTEIYKAFYQYIYGLFQEAGADNIIWIWNPNAKSFPNFKWNDSLCYYPGDQYVDVIGMTNYNTGTYYEGETWTEFDVLYDQLYAEYLEKYEKPLMITEFASSSVGGDKVAWVSHMFEKIKNYDQLKVAIWWSGCDFDSDGNISRPYFLDETDELIQTFKENFKK